MRGSAKAPRLRAREFWFFVALGATGYAATLASSAVRFSVRVVGAACGREGGQ